MSGRAKIIAAYRTEAAQLLREVAAPLFPKEKVKSRIGRAAKQLGWTFVRTHKIWHKNAGRIDAHEMDALRELTGRD
jgi:hypothetical protein